jgi:YbgC/YbaW family acyl-CoA thioester hydrolase
MAATFTQRRRVEFHETDMAGIVHFSVFFRYMEACEHAFVRSLGASVHPGEEAPEGVIGWPRVHASCDYRRPLRYDQEVDVVLTVREKKERALAYDFRFLLPGEGEPLATGRLVVVPVARVDGQIRAVPLPAWAERLAVDG